MLKLALYLKFLFQALHTFVDILVNKDCQNQLLHLKPTFICLLTFLFLHILMCLA